MEILRRRTAASSSILRMPRVSTRPLLSRSLRFAKAWDKPSGGRTRWNKFIVSGQSFDTFVKRECDFVSTVTKGSRLVEDNAELACQINWYRLRTSILTNRHLTGSAPLMKPDFSTESLTGVWRTTVEHFMASPEGQKSC